MAGFIKLGQDGVYDLEQNFFDEIGRKWALIGVKDSENQRINLMTAGWIQTGILWNKPVCTLYIREQRHTFLLAEQQERFSLMFFDSQYREKLTYCGTHSGRDEDKADICGFSVCELDGILAVKEANTVFALKKLYVDFLKEENFKESAPLLNYKNNDFHKFYICEIEAVYKHDSK